MFPVDVRDFPSFLLTLEEIQSNLDSHNIGIYIYIAIIRGSVNDPTTFPPPSRTHGSYHWAFERLLSAGLVPLTVAAFFTSGTNYPLLDGILGMSLVVHSHIGVSMLHIYHLDLDIQESKY